jgi:hypothetical protein
MNCLILLLLLLQAISPVPAPDAPDSPGVYYRQNDKTWVNLPKAPIAETKTKGIGLFVETGGYTNLGTDVVCLGAKATTRVLGPRPTFYVRDLGPSGDVLLIRLTDRKTSRTFHKSSADSTTQNKVGARKSDIRQTAVVVFSEKLFSITPEVDLAPGEYLLVIGQPDSSFDFGIDRKK